MHGRSPVKKNMIKAQELLKQHLSLKHGPRLGAQPKFESGPDRENMYLSFIERKRKQEKEAQKQKPSSPFI